MSRDIYLLGYGVGKKHVEKYLKHVYKADTPEDLGRIAGMAFEELSSYEEFKDHDLARTNTWREGWFEGFYDTAVKIKRW